MSLPNWLALKRRKTMKSPDETKKGLECCSRYGRWTVIQDMGYSASNHRLLLCRCDCGTERIIQKQNLKEGRTKSCGCLRKEVSTAHSTTHGRSNTRLFKTWMNMRQRCNYPSKPEYKYYGGRGIKVCDEWARDFDTFYRWAMANGYAEHLTIDRIDVNGNYEPSNCRWVTMKEQAINKRNTRCVAI